jgi:mannose-6-phosphate isomerase-like protein (cupin superfamily)
VVTGYDVDGKSIILMDGLAPNVMEMAAMPGLALTDLWETRGAPASNEGHNDDADRPIHLEPPRNGSILRIVEFPPDKAWRGTTDGREGFESIGAGHAQDRHSADPMMHQTASVDYIIVLKGEIYAIVDKGETLLKAGDVFIQRGTNHSWSVRGDEPCIIAAILVSAAPVGAAKRPKASKKVLAKKAAAKKTAARAAKPKRGAAPKRASSAKRRAKRTRR